jgi:hypothetical protein
LESSASFPFPELLEFFKTFSEPNEFSLFARNAVDEEEDGIMIEDEDDFDIGVDELLPDSDVRDSLVYALVLSTEIPYIIPHKELARQIQKSYVQVDD